MHSVSRSFTASFCVLALCLTACSSEPSGSGDDAGGVSTDAGSLDTGGGGSDIGGGSGDSGVPTDTGTSTPSDAGPDATTEPDAGDPNPGPGSWKLPEGYFLPAKMPLALVFPRDADAPSWAYAKNAHPGVRWEIPIVVQGGAWPFQYEIVEDGGASGLSIGGELERSMEDGWVMHRVTEEYGVLAWDAPEAGTYAIAVRVNDQDGNSIDVPITLTVGTDGWVFVDPSVGDDANDGTLAAPFATLERVHDGGAEFADHRVYLSGLVPMDGNRDNGNLRVANDTDAPPVWVGFPGSDAVLEAYEGKFVIDRPDFYLANLEHRHHEDYAPDDGSFLHMLTVFSNTDRYTVHDVHFSRFQGVGANIGLGNSSIMMLTASDNGRDHVAVVNNLLSGDVGILTSTYDLRHAVFEKNRAVGADFKIGDGSVWAQIYIKGGNNEFVTLRANEFWDSNTWTNNFAALGLLRARTLEFAYNTISTPWDSGRRGALKLWTNSPLASYSWTDDTPVWVYRNSLHRRVSYEGDAIVNMTDGALRIERNILDTGTLPTSARIAADDNQEGEVVLDAQMKLTPEHRDAHLGRRGAQIAVPAP